MQFSLAWLHEYVDLGGIFHLRRGQDGYLEGFVSYKEALQLGKRLTLLGSDEKPAWRWTAEGLEVDLPATPPGAHAFALRVTTR